jgi:apolipoprotein N-acyltransferase
VISFPVLILLIDGAVAGSSRRFLSAFAVGYAFGFGYFLAGLWWIGRAFLVDAEQFLWLMPVAVVAMPAGLAFFTGLGAALAQILWSPGAGRVLALAIGLSVSDWLRGVVLTGFPWNAFGYGLAANTVLMQPAALIGLYGLSFFCVLILASPVTLLAGHRRFPAALAGVFVLVAAGGAYRLASAPTGEVPGVRLKLMQPNLDQGKKWKPEFQREIVADYVSLTLGADGKGLDGITHVIWPESAFPFLLDRSPWALKTIGEMLPAKAVLLTGAIRGEPPGPGEVRPHYYNALMAVDSNGRVEATFDKFHLVPFGEYLPLRIFLAATSLSRFLFPTDDFAAGPGPRTMDGLGAPPFSPIICYEAIFPGEVTDRHNRPQWLLNVTNDGWFGMTTGPWQHLHQARMRAVEEGLPMVRAANTGISGVFDGVGRSLGQVGLGERGTLDAPLPIAQSETLYSKFGNTVFFSLVVLVSGLVLRLRRD